MPFLGVYDNVRYSPNCTPTYLHWGWGCSFCTFAPQVLFPDYLERGMADTKLHPFLVYILLTAVSSWSVSAMYVIDATIWKKMTLCVSRLSCINREMSKWQSL